MNDHIHILVRTALAFLLLTFINVTLYAQSFGKVDLALVLEESHPIDTTSNACYLVKKAKAHFIISSNKIILEIDRHERIKIYNEEGEKYAEYAIPLYQSGRDEERISGLKAMTFNFENGKMTKTKLNKKDVYTEETSDNWSQRKFAMPNVKSGSVIDIKYTLRTPFYFSIPRFRFQEDIPVEFAEYVLRIPSYYTYTPVPTGFINIERKRRDEVGDSGKEVAYTFVARNVEALSDDEYVLDIDDYRSSIKYELYSAQFPNQSVRYYAKDWNEIAKDLMKHRHFGKVIGKRTKELEDYIESLRGKSKKETIEEIYGYVQNNYAWNGEYGYYKREGIKDLLTKKSGNIGDINLLLINLLLQADIDVKPFLIKSRSSGLLNQSFPSRTEFNYLLAYIPNEQSFMLLDATSKYVPIGQLPRRATNINGLLIDGDNGKIINLDNPNIYKSITMATYDIDLKDPSLSGSGKRVLKNYAATRYRINEDNKKEEEDEIIDEDSDEEEEDDEIKLDNEYEIIEVQNVNDITKQIKISYSENIYNEISMIGDKIFINSTIDFGIADNPFYEEAREFPVFYNTLSDTRQIVKINIPEGYEVESTPDDLVLGLEGSKAKFAYQIKPMGEQLIIDYSFKINSDIFLPAEYLNLKKLYDYIVDKSKEKIVLKPNN